MKFGHTEHYAKQFASDLKVSSIMIDGFNIFIITIRYGAETIHGIFTAYIFIFILFFLDINYTQLLIS